MIEVAVETFMAFNIDIESQGSSEPDFLIILTPFQKSSSLLTLKVVINSVYAEVLIL